MGACSFFYAVTKSADNVSFGIFQGLKFHPLAYASPFTFITHASLLSARLVEFTLKR
jgi:hypothetical protein